MPASSGVAEDMAIVISEGNARPAPTPSSTIVGNRSGRYRAWTGALRNSSSATAASAVPATSVGLAPKRMISRAANPSDSAAIPSATGRNARPTSTAS